MRSEAGTGAPREAAADVTETGGQERFRFTPGGLLLVVTGPSGAGKGVLVERLVSARPACVFSVSVTTRPARETEKDGVHYEFVSREDFERRRSAGEFLEWAEVHGHLYATPARFVDENVKAGRIVVLDVDVQGGASVRRARPEAVSVFIYPPTLEALRERLLARNTDATREVERRLRNAPGEMAQYREYDYLVMNDDLETAVARLIAIVDAERARVKRLKRTP